MSRYADLYNKAFFHGVSETIQKELRAFCADPSRLSNVPRHVHTLVTTQTMCSRDRVPNDLVWWSLALSDMVRRRAARVITHYALDFLYRPFGPWMRRAAARWSTRIPLKDAA